MNNYNWFVLYKGDKYRGLCLFGSNAESATEAVEELVLKGWQDVVPVGVIQAKGRDLNAGYRFMRVAKAERVAAVDVSIDSTGVVDC